MHARALPPPELECFTLGPLLGRGSMGTVYAATDATGREIALKILHDEVLDQAMGAARFEREVEIARRIAHPGVPTIYDAGQTSDGRFYIAMERLVGESLEEWWDTPVRTRLEALELLLEALGPLAEAHRLGVVHRDLKPENVFVLAVPDEAGRRVKLLDFGIARDVGADAKSRTATGIAVGTPIYMSPEQATRPRSVTSAADVWSVGVMMYEVLSGSLPFDGESPHAVIVSAATEAHVPLAERAPSTHAALVSLVERCLRKDPAARPADALELEAELATLLADGDVRATLGPTTATIPSRGSLLQTEERAAPTISGLRLVATPPRRRLRLAVALGLVVLLAGGALYATPEPGERTEAPVITAGPSNEPAENPTPAPERTDEEGGEGGDTRPTAPFDDFGVVPEVSETADRAERSVREERSTREITGRPAREVAERAARDAAERAARDAAARDAAERAAREAAARDAAARDAAREAAAREAAERAAHEAAERREREAREAAARDAAQREAAQREAAARTTPATPARPSTSAPSPARMAPESRPGFVTF